MDREDFLKILKRFEEKTSNKTKDKKPNDQTTIRNDLKRTFFGFSPVYKNKTHKLFLIFVLNKFFEEFELPYYQGMTEIGSVVVDAYFSDVLNNLKNTHGEIKEHELDSVLDISEEIKVIFNKELQKNDNLYQKFKTSLTNIINDKLLALISHNFEKYMELNSSFTKMMNNQFKAKIKANEPPKFMDHTITFFSRLSGNREVAYMLFSLILNSDPSIVFSILANYYEKANCCKRFYLESDKKKNKCLIETIDERDVKKIIDTHKKFLSTNWDLEPKEANGGFFQYKFFYLAAAAALLLSMICLNYRQ